MYVGLSQNAMVASSNKGCKYAPFASRDTLGRITVFKMLHNKINTNIFTSQFGNIQPHCYSGKGKVLQSVYV